MQQTKNSMFWKEILNFWAIKLKLAKNEVGCQLTSRPGNKTVKNASKNKWISSAVIVLKKIDFKKQMKHEFRAIRF